jgi:hypothetical protein
VTVSLNVQLFPIWAHALCMNERFKDIEASRDSDAGRVTCMLVVRLVN